MSKNKGWDFGKVWDAEARCGCCGDQTGREDMRKAQGGEERGVRQI